MSYVEVGLWHDHTQSAMMGWTWTLPHTTANILLSSLTFLVAIAGSCAWTIVALACHSLIVRSRKRVRAVDLQHQVALQNSGSPLDTVLDLLKIRSAWSRAKEGSGNNLRTWALVLVAIFVWTFFAAASILTSLLVDGGSAALVRVISSDCGLIPGESNTTTHKQASAYLEKALNNTIQARNYALDFYMGTSKLRTGHSVYPVTNLTVSIDYQGACPIVNSSRCDTGPGVAPVSMTAYNVDSHLHLGINAPPQDRVAVEFRTTCSVAIVGDLVTKVGNNITIFAGPIGSAAYTYMYNTAATDIGVGYQIERATSFAGNLSPNSSWQAIPDFYRSDADTTMYFLTQNSIYYTDPIEDPLYRATSQKVFGSTTFYVHNSYVDTLVCADQYSLCNPHAKICSNFGSYRDLVSAWKNLTLNDAQRATANRLTDVIGALGTWTSAAALGEKSLFASNHVEATLLSTGLSENQWLMETLGWFQTMLAQFQGGVVEYAYKDELSPDIPVFSPFDLHADDAEGITSGMVTSFRNQCKSQLIRSASSTQNFSFFGILLLVLISFLIISTSLCLPALLKTMSRRVGWISETEKARQADDKLHLLRQTLEGAYDTSYAWERGSWDVPIVRGQAEFGRPRVQNELSFYSKNLAVTPTTPGSGTRHFSGQYTPHMSYQGSMYEEPQPPQPPQQHPQYQQHQQHHQQHQPSQWWHYERGQTYQPVPNPKLEYDSNVHPIN